MEIQSKILWPWEIEDLTGKTAVVIDLWAATSNIALMLGKGVEKITIVNRDNMEGAKGVNNGAVCVGEHYQLSADFFKYSNYPLDVSKIPPTSGILYMTTNGAWVIEQALAKGAKAVTTGSVLNFDAVSQYLQRENHGGIVLIPSGAREKGENIGAEEDWLCAEMFLKRLKGEVVDINGYMEEMKAVITRDYGSQKFDQEANFGIIFKPSYYNVVPICTKERWVLVRDLNAQRNIGL